MSAPEKGAAGGGVAEKFREIHRRVEHTLYDQNLSPLGRDVQRLAEEGLALLAASPNRAPALASEVERLRAHDEETGALLMQENAKACEYAAKLTRAEAEVAALKAEHLAYTEEVAERVAALRAEGEALAGALALLMYKAGDYMGAIDEDFDESIRATEKPLDAALDAARVLLSARASRGKEETNG